MDVSMVAKCRIFQRYWSRSVDFPDEEGTESPRIPAAPGRTFHSSVDFPDEEGTERYNAGALLATLRQFRRLPR